MPVFVDLEELAADQDPMRKLWGLVLLMSIRDHASSVHYHPWRGSGALAYVIKNTRIVMRPPPAAWAEHCYTVARSLLPRRRDRIKQFLFGWESPACGSLILGVGGHELEWELVCWSSSRCFGVEFFRTQPVDNELAPQEVVPAITDN